MRFVTHSQDRKSFFVPEQEYASGIRTGVGAGILSFFELWADREWTLFFSGIARHFSPQVQQFQSPAAVTRCYNLALPVAIWRETVWAHAPLWPPAHETFRANTLHTQERGRTMSGHSKWATIKHKKGALDAKRGKIFTRLIKEITIAAKNGGGDPDKNPRLRKAVADAKAENMPADNIKRAIQRGTGELPGVSYEEFTLEGYGPGGAAVLVEISTDNRNRTVSEIRHAFGKNGGNMAEAGAVAWMFHKKGDIMVPKSATKEDDLMNLVLENGGEDLRDDGESWEVLTDPHAFDAVLEAIKGAGITPDSAEIAMVPQNYVKLEGAAANTMIRLLEAMDDQDDVQHVWSNFDMDIKDLEEVAG
jgi:YebC/PmpR family DNA-binding regulatory protein